LKRTRNLILCLIFLGSCGVLYPPGYHVLKWKSSYADAYRKGDALVMPVWFYGFYESVTSHDLIDMNILPDSVYQFFDVAIRKIPIVHPLDTLRFIHLDINNYSSKGWHDDKLIYTFIESHNINVENGTTFIPIVVYSYGESVHSAGIMPTGTSFKTDLTLWVLVFDQGTLVYRQRSTYYHHENFHNPEEYTFQLEQQHWDSVIQMGFKEYIERME